MRSGHWVLSAQGGRGACGAAGKGHPCVPARTEPGCLARALPGALFHPQPRGSPRSPQDGEGTGHGNQEKGVLRRGCKGPDAASVSLWGVALSVPGTRTLQPPRVRCLPSCQSVRRAGQAVASLRAVKVGVDARQPRRSCQALSLLAFPSLRPSLRGVLLSRSPALRLFTPPDSAAALRHGPESCRGAPGALRGRGRATVWAALPTPTGTDPARWQKAGGRERRKDRVWRAELKSDMSCSGLRRERSHAWAAPPGGQEGPARLSPAQPPSPGSGGVTSQSLRVPLPEEGPRAGPGGPDPGRWPCPGHGRCQKLLLRANGAPLSLQGNAPGEKPV